MPFTTNYGWNVPDVLADADTWGSELNVTIGDIDAKVFTIEEAVNAPRSISITGAATAAATTLNESGNTELTVALSASSQATIDNKISKAGDTFGDLRKSAGGSVLYHTDTSFTAGGIVVSTNAPSGTPANGTIWIQW